jgi:hypothetical protein
VVEHISRDLEANPTSDCVTVTLGDYIDRGSDSRGVLDRLVRNPFPNAEPAARDIAEPHQYRYRRPAQTGAAFLSQGSNCDSGRWRRVQSPTARGLKPRSLDGLGAQLLIGQELRLGTL